MLSIVGYCITSNLKLISNVPVTTGGTVCSLPLVYLNLIQSCDHLACFSSIKSVDKGDLLAIYFIMSAWKRRAPTDAHATDESCVPKCADALDQDTASSYT